MKFVAKISLIIGVILPLVLAVVASCNGGPLSFLRGQNAYMTVHSNGSFDYNNTAAIDELIVTLISSLLVGFYFLSRDKSADRSARRQVVVNYIIYLVVIEFVMYVGTYFIVGFRCPM